MSRGSKIKNCNKNQNLATKKWSGAKSPGRRKNTRISKNPRDNFLKPCKTLFEEKCFGPIWVSTSMLNHYGILTGDITVDFIKDLRKLNIQYEIHLARTRLWLDPQNTRHNLFYIKYSSVLRDVVTENYAGIAYAMPSDAKHP